MCVNDWIKHRIVKFNQFYFLSKKFVEKQKLRSLFMSGKMLYAHLQHHNDTIIKTHTDFIKYTSHFIARFERFVWRFTVRGSWRPNRTEIFWPPLFWLSRCVFLFFLYAQPEALGSTLLGAGFLYCILSATSLVSKLHRGSRGPPRPDVAFPTTSRPTPAPTLLQLALDFRLDCVI